MVSEASAAWSGMVSEASAAWSGICGWKLYCILHRHCVRILHPAASFVHLRVGVGHVWVELHCRLHDQAALAALTMPIHSQNGSMLGPKTNMPRRRPTMLMPLPVGASRPGMDGWVHRGPGWMDGWMGGWVGG